MSDATVTAIEPSTVRRIQVLHETRQGLFPRHEQQMIVIPQQTIREAIDCEPVERSLQTLEEVAVVNVVFEQALLGIAAREDVARDAGPCLAKQSFRGGSTLDVEWPSLLDDHLHAAVRLPRSGPSLGRPALGRCRK